ncbi:hypothetical protein [Longimicrobium sp.]|uniref:hypothetical protein n=1 Tax=Longimicrobium sp. TaxID=2029185 RepID=UPI002E310A38|nr:hypothetical protein [Longimicrobium sp.]HEX6038753.1 hypothetical protein [Longimicrobium sp.]
MKTFLSERLGWASTAVLAAGALVLALLFANVLGAYWDFYYLDAPGSGTALEFFMTPAAFILALGCAAVVARAAMRRMRGAAALSLGLLVAALLLTALLAGEFAMTRSARAGEGGGDLLPFFEHHLGLDR